MIPFLREMLEPAIPAPTQESDFKKRADLLHRHYVQTLDAPVLEMRRQVTSVFIGTTLLFALVLWAISLQMVDDPTTIGITQKVGNWILFSTLTLAASYLQYCFIKFMDDLYKDEVVDCLHERYTLANVIYGDPVDKRHWGTLHLMMMGKVYQSIKDIDDKVDKSDGIELELVAKLCVTLLVVFAVVGFFLSAAVTGLISVELSFSPMSLIDHGFGLSFVIYAPICAFITWRFMRKNIQVYAKTPSQMFPCHLFAQQWQHDETLQSIKQDQDYRSCQA